VIFTDWFVPLVIESSLFGSGFFPVVIYNPEVIKDRIISFNQQDNYFWRGTQGMAVGLMARNASAMRLSFW
jgi:hypothetical protein